MKCKGDIIKFSNPMLVVLNIETSKRFYYEVLGLEVIDDFGANVTLTGGIALQTKDTWSITMNIGSVIGHWR